MLRALFAELLVLASGFLASSWLMVTRATTQLIANFFTSLNFFLVQEACFIRVRILDNQPSRCDRKFCKRKLVVGIVGILGIPETGEKIMSE